MGNTGCVDNSVETVEGVIDGCSAGIGIADVAADSGAAAGMLSHYFGQKLDAAAGARDVRALTGEVQGEVRPMPRDTPTTSTPRSLILAILGLHGCRGGGRSQN